jgi:hypothetical protein
VDYVDPSGHWCVSMYGRWQHEGGCSDSTSIYSDDMLHDRQYRVYDGHVDSTPFYYDANIRYLRWKLGEQQALDSAPPEVRELLVHKAWFDTTPKEAFNLVCFWLTCRVRLH